MNETDAHAALPLMSDQADRLAIQEWVEEQGFGAEPRMFGRGFRVSGPLDVDLLSRSLDQLVARHEALRVVFPERGRRGHQLIAPPSPLPLPVEDLSELAADDRPAEAARRLGDHLSRNLDLSGGLLASAKVLRIGPDDHAFGLAVDHLVADGQSFEILVAELWELYGAGHRGDRPDLPAVDFGYADYVRWEAESLAGPAPREAIDRFRELLDGLGVNPPLRLGGREPVPNVRYRVGSLDRSLPAETCDAVADYVRAARVTPFVTLLSAYLCALSACGAGTELGVLIPVTRRTEERLLPMVGLLSTYATLPGRIDPAESFRALCRRMRGAVLQVQRLGAVVPAPAVTGALAPHMLGRLLEYPSTFFDVAPGGWTGGRREVAGLTVEPMDVPADQNQIESVELFASVAERAIDFTVVFPVEVVDPGTVARLADVFAAVVHGAVTGPDRPTGELVAEAAAGRS